MTGGALTAPGDATGLLLARGMVVGLGGIGVAIVSNSDTVTDLKSFPVQLIECRRHRFDGGGMNIVREHDRTGSRFFQNSTAHYARSRSLPVERVHIPDDDPITELVMDPALLVRRDVTRRVAAATSGACRSRRRSRHLFS